MLLGGGGEGGQEGRESLVGVGADDQANALFEKGGLEALGHAAEEADGFLLGFEFGDALQDLIFSVGSDGAGVEEDEVGLGGIGGVGVAVALEDGGDNGGVVGVHLAAVGFDVELGAEVVVFGDLGLKELGEGGDVGDVNFVGKTI